MQEVLVAGAGKIGALMATLLLETKDYNLHIIDQKTKLGYLNVESTQVAISQISVEAAHRDTLNAYIQQNNITAVISCLPYFCNTLLAEIAKENTLHYFDLTEDVTVCAAIKSLAMNGTSVFMPQCGLAPGFISIVANELMQHFNSVNAVFMRAGALPAYSNNALKYSLTWSTDGLINEYGNPCRGIKDAKQITLQPLENLESVIIDGVEYEAFNTSGGLGTLVDTFDGKVKVMNYKTLRYPGHCEKMRLLMNDLKLNTDRKTLKNILEKNLPKVDQDVVLIYVVVDGECKGEFVEKAYVKKIYPKIIAGKSWSAIQVATAASACAVVDLVLQSATLRQGFVLQESISLSDFMHNRFGQYFL